MKIKNNTVYEWRGGGYDGCIWEPNMGFVDGSGEWHPVISTGSGALDTIEDLKEALLEDPEDWRGHQLREFPADQDGIDLLQKTVRLDFVAVLADALVEHGYGVQMRCTKCGELFDPEYDSYKTTILAMQEAGFYRGDGGIGVITDDLWCYDCMSETRCTKCDAFGLDPSGMSFPERFFYDWMGFCENCSYPYIHRVKGVRDRLDDLEEQLDSIKSDFRKYAYIMREKKHPDLKGCLKRAKDEVRAKAKAMVNGVRDWIQEAVKSAPKEISRNFDPSEWSGRLQ